MQRTRPVPRQLCVNVQVGEDFATWAAAERPALVRFARLVLGSHAAAEDAVQDALASAHAHPERIEAARDRGAYVRRMVVNAHHSAWRKSRRLVPVEDVRRPAGSAATAKVELADLVWRACATLPAKQRAAVVLRFYEDLDYPEIARVLDCTESTARAGVHRGLAALRRVLEEEGWSDD